MARVSTHTNKKHAQLVRWAEELAQLVKDSRMSELRLEQGNQSLRIRRSTDESGPAPAAAASEAPRAVPTRADSSGEDFGTPVSSRFVGVFRSQHPKTGKPMIQANDTAESNQVLGWVECMGIRHEVVAPRAGTVAEVLVDDAEPVEFGQVLLVIQ
jgi:acetyl-CoA carboxylase biotin carboxyl carrier protein